jgi:hypothetical protein
VCYRPGGQPIWNSPSYGLITAATNPDSCNWSADSIFERITLRFVVEERAVTKCSQRLGAR